MDDVGSGEETWQGKTREVQETECPNCGSTDSYALHEHAHVRRCRGCWTEYVIEGVDG